MTWVATVSYRHPRGGSKHTKVQLYDTKGKPDRTRVIRDLVPHGYLTTSISIKQKKGR